MKLFIDTSDGKKTTVKLEEMVLEKTSISYDSQQVLILIEEILKKNKKTLQDLTEVKVNLGPGSFTGLRIGMAVANTLGFVLDIPVNGKRQLVLPKYE
jgi:tRNA threonylcarbamoyladenosine biosynthesis protein TsaB